MAGSPRTIFTHASRPRSGPTTDLTRQYGTPGTLSVGTWTGTWYALVHPGNRSKAWRDLHASWVERITDETR